MEKNGEKKIFNINTEKKTHLIVSFGIFFTLTIARIIGVWGDNKPLKKIKEIFSHAGFNIGFLLILSCSIFILGLGGAKTFTNDPIIYNSYIESTKKAILAIIIAMFAKIELILPVFWLIWLTAFYLEGWS